QPRNVSLVQTLAARSASRREQFRQRDLDRVWGMTMKRFHRALMTGALFVAAFALTESASAEVVKYIRYEAQGRTSYGILDGETVRELSAAPWANGKATNKTQKLSAVKLLAPAEPSKVVCAGLNYKSHIGQQAVAKYVGLFSKPPTAIVPNEAD